jgi:hypothetical protein
MSAWTYRSSDAKAAVKIVPPCRRIPWWKGLIWSQIDADGNLRFYAIEHRPKPADANRGNVTTLGTAARKRKLKREVQT